MRYFFLLSVFLLLACGACKDRTRAGGLLETQESEATQNQGDLESFTRANFLKSIHGKYPPVGRSAGILVTVQLGRFGAYDSAALDQLVEALTPRLLNQLQAGAPLSYVVVAIASGQVFGPAGLVTKKISEQDVARRAYSAHLLGMKTDELKDVMLITQDTSSWYRKHYGIEDALAMTVLDHSGRPVGTCAIPADSAKCLEKFDQLIGG